MNTPSIIPPNRMKQALKAGQPVIGTMLVELRQPSVMQILKAAGFDFVIIDSEHGPFNDETIADLSRAARQLDLTPIVRVPDMQYPYIARALDGGAQGIMLPRVTDAVHVQEAVSYMKYPPMGRRGCAFARGSTDFRGGPLAESMRAANEETLFMVQIETVEALEDIDSILEVPGVDAALLGPTDLSIALGEPGQIDSPVMQDAIRKTIAACQRHDVAPAIQLLDLDAAAAWADSGMRVLSLFSEMTLLLRGGAAVASTLRTMLDGDA
jgi:2-keto-3-deoxy-L-rhamnonate aldolase RhmA